MRIAVASVVAGGVAGLAIAVTYALGDISLKQTIMLALPAAILILGGLTVAMTSDPETVERQGFRAGMKAGSLRRRWRSALGRGRQGKNKP